MSEADVASETKANGIVAKRRVAIGWITVAGSILITSFWAFWGGNENFHEGWYHDSLAKNLFMMFIQYMSWMLIFMAAALVGVRWPRVGCILHIAAAVVLIWFLWDIHPSTLAKFYVPLFLLAIGFAVGTPQPRGRAYALIIAIPLTIFVGLGVEPAIRVAGRVDDMDRGPRRIAGNGVDLIWAPRGPGWPDPGTKTWNEAVDICQHLSADGKELMETPQNIWRLPTAEEFVRSQHRGNKNCEGTWDPIEGRPTYQRRPDKESPLWATDSLVIYWWIGTEVDEDRAYKAAYQGNVRPAQKSQSFPYWGFRAVKEPTQ